VPSINGSHNSPSARCAAAAEATNRHNDIFNVKSTLINGSLDADILTKKIKILYQIVGVVRSLMVHVNCGLNFVRLGVTNLILFYIVYPICLCKCFISTV
jgi:hypothetical protein